MLPEKFNNDTKSIKYLLNTSQWIYETSLWEKSYNNYIGEKARNWAYC